jgi:hypothetical protein
MRSQLYGTRQLDDEAGERKKKERKKENRKKKRKKERKKKKCNFVTGVATTPLWNTCDGPTVHSLDNRLLSVKD